MVLLSVISAGFNIYCYVSFYVYFFTPWLCPQCCIYFVYRNNLKSRMVLSFSTKKLYLLVRAPMRTSNPSQGLRYSETELQAPWGSMYTSNGPLLLRCSSGSISPNTMQGKKGILPLYRSQIPRHQFLPSQPFKVVKKHSLTS